MNLPNIFTFWICQISKSGKVSKTHVQEKDFKANEGLDSNNFYQKINLGYYGHRISLFGWT
jgi:hypothetical protein